MSTQENILNLQNNNERNKKRREKRKKHKGKKDLKSDIASATERIQLIHKKLNEEKNNVKKETTPSLISRSIIELLLEMNLDNKPVPECYSFYKVKVYQSKDSNVFPREDENYLEYDGEMIKFHLRNGKNTKIKFSDHIHEIVYLFDDDRIRYIFSENIWKEPSSIWSDTKGFGRGMKRKLSSLLDVPEDYGYSMVFFMKDLELYKKKKTPSNVHIWKNVQLEFNLDEAFDKFKSEVITSQDGFIAYDELSKFRDDKYKLKFNELIVNHYGDSVERGFRKQNKRGFKGLSFK